MPVVVELGVIAVMLVGVGWLAVVRRGYLGGIIAVQCSYFLLSYVIRPLILLWVQPEPRLGDSLADPRMASLGYEVALSAVLRVVGFGIMWFSAFAVIALLTLRRSKNRQRSLGTSPPVVTHNAAWAVLIAGWAFRLTSLAVHSTITDTLAAVGSVGAGALLLFHLKDRRLRDQITVVTLVSASELAWSVLSASKAPIFACGLWLLVAGINIGVQSKRRVLLGGLVAAGLLVIFPLVQQSKVAAGTFQDVQGSADAYPSIIRGVIPVVRRFDLVSAGMDSVSAGEGSWITGLEGLRRGVLSLIPTQLQADKPSSTGATWAVEVRGQTVEYSNTGVHLADGPIAEGYVIGGDIGVFVEVLLVALVTAVVAGGLSRRSRFCVLFGVSMLTQPFLFERGMLGIAEAVGKSLEVVVVANLICLGVRLWIETRGAFAGRSASDLGIVDVIPVKQITAKIHTTSGSK